jgi:hypothetical protein
MQLPLGCGFPTSNIMASDGDAADTVEPSTYRCNGRHNNA